MARSVTVVVIGVGDGTLLIAFKHFSKINYSSNGLFLVYGQAAEDSFQLKGICYT
ncbi:hypothetical protein [Candidatus Bartonella washoeensis]|uniref:Uncharacterized protein n=1 Tax=Cardidatus Bartonella washoeensis 085-0475 TaxID=1094564 RepID=J1JER4_9HYPH|nr:hypothetical protein [Bartonella washoeensis]EJF82575.1 hypothetical protein MCW_01642 [Bartonella washoeensis 085-0475]